MQKTQGKSIKNDERLRENGLEDGVCSKLQWAQCLFLLLLMRGIAAHKFFDGAISPPTIL